MVRLKQFLILIVNIAILIIVSACSKPASVVRQHAEIEPQVEREKEYSEMPSTNSLDEKMQRLKIIETLVTRGDITVKGRKRNISGSFIMVIDGEDLDMEISSKGIPVADITLKDGKVHISTSLKDEYHEYMFAVILRDAIMWWNIFGYDVVDNKESFILRNSWKKIYLNALSLVPEKQVVRMRRHREVTVTYSNTRNFGIGMFPSRLEFHYATYQCNVTINRIDVEKITQN